LGKKGQVNLLTFMLCGLAQVTFILLSYLATFKNNIDSEWMRQALSYFQAHRRTLFPMFVMYFLFGRWLGANYQEVTGRLEKNRRLLVTALLVSGAIVLWESWLLQDWTHGTVTLPSDWSFSANIYAFLLILYALPRLKAVKQPIVNYLLLRLGALSFIVYLLHEPLLGYLMRAISYYVPSSNNLPLLMQPVLLITTILISYVIYRMCLIAFPSAWVRIMFGIKTKRINCVPSCAIPK
jgi:peptidoglycan/LPS O-acetylase OafA/YrhL